LPLIALVFLAACGDWGDPNSVSYTGAWRLTLVNTQALPSPSTLSGSVWVAGVLQLNEQTGSYDWCREDPSTSTQTSTSDYLVLAPISGDRIEVSYFTRREAVPDTAAVNGNRLSLRLRSVSLGGQVNGVDVLTFVRLTGDVPSACSLVP
jgi:hypothetical protein